MKTRTKRLIKVGKTDVRNAIGFFWIDNGKIFVAATQEDVDKWSTKSSVLRPMEELEQAFKDSHALRFVSWCGSGAIVRQGARQVTFEYDTHKSIMHIK